MINRFFFGKTTRNLIFQQHQISQNHCRNCFQHNRNTQGNTQIVTTFYRERFYFARIPVKRSLFLWCGRSRLYGDTKLQFIVIGNAANNTTRMVSGCFASTICNGIIMFNTKHSGSSKASTKFNPFYRRNSKHCMTN